MEPYTYCRQVLPTQYVTNWFSQGAKEFFGSVGSTGMLKEKYFITHDRFFNTNQWALRYVNIKDGCIDTIQPAPLNTEKECRELLLKQFLKDK